MKEPPVYKMLQHLLLDPIQALKIRLAFLNTSVEEPFKEQNRRIDAQLMPALLREYARATTKGN